jgi:1-aminocyclopropane-1-carboxylate deaminase/D-cysteine desulfhydrase-like pyridoxal-dependent ACC family enzyme
LIYQQTSAQSLESAILSNAGISLRMWREDLNHPFISGNKWWKLKYNLETARKEGHTQVLTFGGAYSNHLYATAAAAHELGFKSIGIVRGEETLPLNATLVFCKSKGMHLHYISRGQYREKDSEAFIQWLRKEFGEFYLIPEGGTNAHAIKGCEEWAHRIREVEDFDYLCLPVGTAGTMAGMVNVLTDKSIIGFSSLKGGDFLKEKMKQWLTHDINNWQIRTEYHFGGYAKVKSDLLNFIIDFEKEYQIPIDPVYTSKMMYGVFDLIQQNTFERGSKILVVHTGGLQGRAGFNF